MAIRIMSYDKERVKMFGMKVYVRVMGWLKWWNVGLKIQSTKTQGSNPVRSTRKSVSGSKMLC